MSCVLKVHVQKAFSCPCATATSGADDEAEVELQLQRISDALMPEYRREAVGQLKDLLLDSQGVRQLLRLCLCLGFEANLSTWCLS